MQKKIILIVGVLVVTGAVGILVFLKKSSSPVAEEFAIPEEAVPSDWATYKSGEYSDVKFTFRYPKELIGTLSGGVGASPLIMDEGGKKRAILTIIPDYMAEDTKTARLYPGILIGQGLVASSGLGPLHSLALASPFSDQSVAEAADKAIISHVAQVTFESFCNELSAGPLEHAKHLKISKAMQKEVMGVEQSGDLISLFGESYTVSFCRKDEAQRVIEYATISMVPEILGAPSNLVEQKRVAVLKFFPTNALDARNVEFFSMSDNGKNKNELSEDEIIRTLRMMTVSFQLQ